jgi:hypothetical protein
MLAYWRVRKWRVNITVSGGVVGSIGCDVEMNIADELQLVCGQRAQGFEISEMSVPGYGIDTTVFLSADVFPFGIFIDLEFRDFPEGGDSLIQWATRDSYGSNQIALKMGGITKNLQGQYFGTGDPVPSATGTMEAIQWWSYDGLYNTSTGERL